LHENHINPGGSNDEMMGDIVLASQDYYEKNLGVLPLLGPPELGVP